MKNTDCLGVSDNFGAWLFFFLISAKQISFFALLAIFVMPIFYSVSIIEIMNEYLFFIPINNPVYRSTSVAFARISVLIGIRLHTILKVF